MGYTITAIFENYRIFIPECFEGGFTVLAQLATRAWDDLTFEYPESEISFDTQEQAFAHVAEQILGQSSLDHEYVFWGLDWSEI